jgi:branched-chain amino acid transport system permease protein
LILLISQIIVSGIIFGCIYGLAALGMVLIYKTSDIVNFAQGEMAMITTFIGFMLFSKLGFSYITSFGLSLLFAALLGAIVYILFLKPIQSSSPISLIVLTLGLYMVFHGIAGLIWGHTPTTFPKAFEGSPYEIGGVFITPNEIFVVLLTMSLMILLYLLFKFTKVGLAMRAAAQDMLASELMGIKVTKVFVLTWALGTILGGVSGMLIAPTTFLHPSMMAEVLIMAFAAAVLGGFVSLPGAVMGGIIIGIFGNLVSFYIGPELRLVFVFILIIVVLIIRPTGLFGGVQYIKKV